MCPSYGRSHNHLPNFIQSAIDTASDPARVHFAFLVNSGDQQTKDFIQNFNFAGHQWEMIEEGLPAPHLAKYYNMLYAMTNTRDEAGTVVSMCGDDFIFRTKNWDKALLDSINHYEGIGCFYCNDDFIGREKLCVNLFLTRKFITLTEHPFMCELYPAEFIDFIWTEVGRFTKTLHFLADVHIFHDHGSKNPDSTYNRLQPFRKEGWRIGKAKAKEIAFEIAQVLLKKGIKGDSIC